MYHDGIGLSLILDYFRLFSSSEINNEGSDILGYNALGYNVVNTRFLIRTSNFDEAQLGS